MVLLKFEHLEELMVKKSLYMLHGLMGTAESHFSPQIEALCEKFELIPIDFPGHGSNELEATSSFFENTIQWMIEEVKSKGPGLILGQSLGASVALHSAIRHPELFEGVIVTGYAPTIPENMQDLMQQQYEYFMKIDTNNPAVANQFKELHGKRWFDTMRYVLEDFTFHYPVASDSMIEKLQVPTLILNGADEKHEREAVCHLANLNPKITVGLIPNAGHQANLEQPELYNRLVLDYWKNY